MNNQSSYIMLNAGELETVYDPISTPHQWPAQQPVAGLAKSQVHPSQDDMPGSLMDCLVTIGIIMFLLFSSSVMLGFAMDQLTQGMVMLMRESAAELRA